MSDASVAMRSGFRELSIRGHAVFGTGMETAITAADVVSARVSEGSERGILPGDVLSAECRLVLDDSGGQWQEGGARRGVAPLVGAKFSLEMGVKTGGQWKYSPMGVFVCREVESDENGSVVTLICQDRIALDTQGEFEDWLNYPATLGDIWEHIIAQTDYSFDGEIPCGDMVIDDRPAWGNISVRTAMGYVAQAAGCFVREDRGGNLKMIPLVRSAERVQITPGAYLSRRRQDGYFGPVHRFYVTTVNHDGDNDSEPDTIEIAPEAAIGMGSLAISGNPLYISKAAHVQALAEATAAALAGLSYAECRFTWRGDPALIAGDYIRVTGLDESAADCMLSRQTLEFSGGLYAECVCGIPETQNAEARISGGSIDAGRLAGLVPGMNIAADSITARKIAAGAITAEKIAAGAITAEKISAGAVTADKISAGAVNASKIEAGSITAQQLQAGLITADSGLIAVGAIQTAQIADASITSAKIVELDAELIKSGTLMTERLLLVGEGGVVYEINAASSGLSQTELAKDKYKNYLNGTVIVANSITAAQIAAGTITANEIAANAITAAKINVADLFASEATIAAINAMDIRSNTYLQLYVGDQIGDIDEFRAGTTVEITKDIFRVTAATTQFAVPGTEEDGQEIVAIDADGLRADTVAKAGKGGVFTVGEGGDFEYLADAFGSVNERYIAEDVTFRILSASDPGGVLRGVTGPGRVHIMPANISAYADTAAWTASGVTVNQLTNGVYLQASGDGTWKRATLKIGRVGALGIIGKRLRLKAKMGTYNSTVTGIVMQMIPTLGETALAYIAHTGSVTAGVFQTRSGSFVIPEWANYWDELSVTFELSEGTSVSSGAQVYYYELVLGIGEEALTESAVTAVTLNSLTIDGCAAEVCMHELVFPGRLTARQSATAVNRCTFTGNHGYHVYGGSGFMNACYGSCAYAAIAAMAGGAVQIYGTAPAGEKTGLVETANMSTGAPGGNTPVTSTTLTVQAKDTGTYDGTNGWWSGAAIRQGYTAGNGRMRGGIWFDLSALPGGAVISKLTLRLRRVEGYGKGGAVNVKIYGTTSPAKSGAPAVAGSAVTGTIGAGKTKTFDVTSLKAYSGFVLYADDTAAVSGKTYSANYARFTGTGGGADTIPTLIATYTV